MPAKKILFWFGKIFAFPSIRTKLLVFSIVMALILGLTSLYSHYNAKFFLDSLVGIFQRNQDILALESKITRIEKQLADYLGSKGSESLLQYWKTSQELYETVWAIDRQPEYDQAHLIRKNIAALTEAYLKSTEKAVSAKRGRDIPGYISAYEEAEKTARYLRSSIDQLNLKDFQTSLTLGAQVSQRLQILQILNNILIVDLIALSLILSFWFSWRLTQPLTELATAAKSFAGGKYDTKISIEGRDETASLAKAFHSMRLSIIKNIQDLKEKAEIENGLMEERLKNLQMKNLLKNAELQALQAQINPHFLFNTLNAGAQIAMMEEAEQTSRFLENLSDLLRHNVRQLDRPVDLTEEIKSLDSYVYLLKIRFAERFEFIKNIELGDYNLKVPAMILQPLVENALLHGLKDSEKGGIVRLSVHRNKTHTTIVVFDNGEGMDDDKIRRFLTGEGDIPESHSSQSTGIGLGNVISRLRLFFDDPDVVTIQSNKPGGTKITLHLPHLGGDSNV